MNGMSFVANGRRNYLRSQVPKPENGSEGWIESLDRELVSSLKKKTRNALTAVRKEIVRLDSHPDRLELLRRIKLAGRSRKNKEAIDWAEKKSEPTHEEKKIMDRLIFLVKEERNLRRFLGFLKQQRF